ncbi:Golgi phosphoprotein 3-domain-containing protein [Spinellus fusiger]|nr:Golgi phosphoprotein 3-domain-containing protein [Spinellus fusiger]
MSSGLTRRHVRQTSAPEDNDTADIDLQDPTMPRLTLLEEVLLLGLKDEQGHLSFWNDHISYVLRGCILLELSLRNRIAMVKQTNRRTTPLCDRHIQVINDRNTGEMLLDETLKLIKASEPMSVQAWIDLLSGETWNVLKLGYQLKQVRERLAKGLVDKGILRTEKRNFFLFDMATHPLQDRAAKEGLMTRVCSSLVARNTTLPSANQPDQAVYLVRTVCMLCSAYAANVLENALMCLDYESREKAYAKVDELLADFSVWPLGGSGTDLQIPADKALSMEIVPAVLSVFTKMDSIAS